MDSQKFARPTPISDDYGSPEKIEVIKQKLLNHTA